MIRYAESKTKFVNISVKTRQTFYVVKLRPGGCQFMKKQSSKISCYSPFNNFAKQNHTSRQDLFVEKDHLHVPTSIVPTYRYSTSTWGHDWELCVCVPGGVEAFLHCPGYLAVPVHLYVQWNTPNIRPGSKLKIKF